MGMDGSTPLDDPDALEREPWQIRDIHEGILEANAEDFATEAEVNAVFAKCRSYTQL